MISFYASNLIFIQATFINLLLVLSIQVPLRAGSFSMAGVGCYGIGAYATAILTTKAGWAPWPAIIVSIVIAALVSYLLGVVLGRLGGLYLAMATIAFDLIVKVVAFNGGDLTGGALGLFGGIDAIGMPEIIISVIAIIVVLQLSERGRFGRRVEAARDDPQLAGSMGVDVVRIRRLAFAVSGALAGLSGSFNFLLRSTISPEDIQFSLLVAAFTMLIVGGVRSWRGALIGVIIFTWLPHVFEPISDAMPIVYGVLVTVVAVWAPQGVLGLWNAFIRWRAARRRGSAPPPENESGAVLDAVPSERGA